MELFEAIAKVITNIVRFVADAWGVWAGLGIMTLIFYVVRKR